MLLHMTKVAYGCAYVGELREWLESHGGGEARTSTRYLPKRHQEMVGGSLFWIHHHVLIGRTPLLGFAQREEDGRWWIRMEPRLVAVRPIPRRAHQGWRYLAGADAPPDLGGDAEAGEALPGRLVSELAKLGLV
ncbi:MAG: DUF1489 domain-containing protein [Novosphingobium sp.]|nr:DUF1489 domain-containing protein [Novosphingobium sp.]